MNKNYFQAIATMVGTIIGVGLFSIPFVIAKAGILPLLLLLPALAFVQHLFHKYYAEIVMATEEKHRLPGYVERYFGKKSRNVVLLVVLTGAYGSLLAYIIIGGIFLNQLLLPYFGSHLFFYTTLLFVLQALIVLFGLKLIAKVETLLTVLLLLTLMMIFGKSMNYFDINNFTPVNWLYFLLPYGPIFFAVGGDAAIPEVCRLLTGEKQQIKRAIAWGTYIPAIFTFLFIVAVVGVTGVNTTPDTLVGLSGVFPQKVIDLAVALGLLAIVTSFITVAQATKEIFVWDLQINKKISWLLALLPSFFLYLVGMKNLTKVVGFTGSVTGGLIGIILIWLFFKVKNGSHEGVLIETKLTRNMAIFLSCLFAAGFLYSFVEIF